MISDNLWAGPTVRLTALTKEDAKTFSGWYNDAGFLRLLHAEAAKPRTEEEIARQFEEWQKDPTVAAFAVRPLDSDELLAGMTLDGILWNHGVAWLSVGIGKRELWGKGYGRAALTLLLNYGFNELNLHRIQLTVYAYNERGVALYEKLGFRREGIYREFLLRDGQRHDMYLYGLLRSEWETQKNEA